MNVPMPTCRHPKVITIAEVKVRLVTYQPLSDELAARVVHELWRSQATLRAAKKKLVTVHWLGDAALAASLPAPPRVRPKAATGGGRREG